MSMAGKANSVPLYRFWTQPGSRLSIGLRASSLLRSCTLHWTESRVAKSTGHSAKAQSMPPPLASPTRLPIGQIRAKQQHCLKMCAGRRTPANQNLAKGHNCGERGELFAFSHFHPMPTAPRQIQPTTREELKEFSIILFYYSNRQHNTGKLRGPAYKIERIGHGSKHQQALVETAVSS